MTNPGGPALLACPRLRRRTRSGRGATAGAATTEGRLTFTELTERTEAPYTATTGGELARIADLPAAAGSPASPVPATAGTDSGWVVAIMGDTKRQGRWRVERPQAALAVMGYVVLDCGAEVPQDHVAIAATASWAT